MGYLRLIKIIFALYMIALLAACGGGGGGGNNETVPPPPQETLTFSFNIPSSVNSKATAVLRANVAYNGTETLTYNWSLTSSCGTLDSNSSAAAVFTAADTESNLTCDISLTVSAGRLTSSQSTKIAVLGSGPAEDPLFAISLDHPGIVPSASSVRLSAQVTYTGLETVYYNWSVPASCGSLSSYTEISPLFTAITTAQDISCPFSLTVSAGIKSSEVSGNFIIKGNHVVLGISLDIPPVIAADTSMTWNAAVQYTGSDSFSYKWSVSPGCGTLSGPLTPTPMYHAPAVNTNLSCTASLTVNAGAATAAASADFILQGNPRETILAAAITTPKELQAGSSATLNARIIYTGVEEILTYRWTVPEQCGTLTGESAETAVFTAGKPELDLICLVGFTVSDGLLEYTVQKDILIKVGAVPPGIILDIPLNVYSTQQVIWNAEITYTGNSDIAYFWYVTPACGSLDDPAAAAPVFTAVTTENNLSCQAELLVTTESGSSTAFSNFNILSVKGEIILTAAMNIPATVTSEESTTFRANVTYTGSEELAYVWSVTPSCGTLSNFSAVNPVFTAAAVSQDTVCTVTLNVSAGNKNASTQGGFTVTKGSGVPVAVVMNIPPKVPSGGFATFSATLENTAVIPEYSWQVSPECGDFEASTGSRTMFASTPINGQCYVTVTARTGEKTYSNSQAFEITEAPVAESLEILHISASPLMVSGGWYSVSAEINYLGMNTPLYYWSVPSTCATINNINSLAIGFTVADTTQTIHCDITFQVTTNSGLTKRMTKTVSMVPVTPVYSYFGRLRRSYTPIGTYITGDFRDTNVVWQSLGNTLFTRELSVTPAASQATIKYETSSSTESNTILYYFEDGAGAGFHNRSALNPNLTYYKNTTASTIVVPSAADSDGYYRCVELYYTDSSNNIEWRRLYTYQDYAGCIPSTDYPTPPYQRYITPLEEDLHLYYKIQSEHTTSDFKTAYPVWTSRTGTTSNLIINSTLRNSLYYQNNGVGFLNRPGENTRFFVNSSYYYIPYSPDADNKYQCIDRYSSSGSTVIRVTFAVPGFTGCDNELYASTGDTGGGTPPPLPPESGLHAFQQKYEAMTFHADNTTTFAKANPDWTRASSTNDMVLDIEKGTIGTTSVWGYITDFMEGNGQGFFGRASKYNNLTHFSSDDKEVYFIGSDPDQQGSYRCLSVFHYNINVDRIYRYLYEAVGYDACEWPALYDTLSSNYLSLANSYTPVAGTAEKTSNFSSHQVEWTPISSYNGSITVSSKTATSATISIPNLTTGTTGNISTTFYQGTGKGVFGRKAILNTLHYFEVSGGTRIIYPYDQDATGQYQCVTIYQQNGSSVYRETFMAPGHSGCSEALYETTLDGFEGLYEGTYHPNWYYYTLNFSAASPSSTTASTSVPVEVSNLTANGFDLTLVDPIHPNDYMTKHFSIYYHENGNGFFGRSGQNLTYFMSDDGTTVVFPHRTDGVGKYRELSVYFHYNGIVFTFQMNFPGSFRTYNSYTFKPY